MADDDDLRLPLEIPWKLASTTQPLSGGGAAETSMSLFFYEPDDESLTSTFPDEKLVYIKVTVSVSPAKFPAGVSPVAAPFLGEGVPCFHLLLDLKVTSASGEAGTIRPYFHAAAPLQRRMIQTGVAGAEIFEGEADSQFMGKSGSQLYESLRSSSSTSSGSAGFSFFGLFGASGHTTSTDVAANRAVSQVVDSTTREASEERRQLVSHLTRVENVLTLLTAKSLGTPYLSFSLSPRPLQLLSIDASDPNLWFNELLARRSSGIEGIQEFTAVIVAPRNEGFCVQTRLRRVCLLDNPPGPFRDEPLTDGFLQLLRVLNYLYRMYPPGTPLEELDIDITGHLTPASEFSRPVIERWAVRQVPAQIIEVIIASPGAIPGVERRARVNYKHVLEVWLETLRDEYDQEVSRSPLERGALLGENRRLDTCFAPRDDAGLAVTSSGGSVSPLFPVDLGPYVVDVGHGGTRLRGAARTVRSGAFETITRWNIIERRAAGLLANRDDFPEKAVRLEDSRILGVLVDRWEKMGPDDPRNLGFEQAAEMLELSPNHKRLLRAAGATDLRGIARTLKAAPEIERQNEDIRRLRTLYKKRKVEIEPPDLVRFPVSPAQGESIQTAIASMLRDPVKS